MAFESVWSELVAECSDMDPAVVLVTPDSGRAFTVEEVKDDRIVVEFAETGVERPLWYDQLAYLHDSLDAEDGGLSLSGLPRGVEPYVSVLTLSSAVAVDESRGVLERTETGTAGESPFLRSEWAVRAPHERVHDDALLLVDLLDEYDLGEPADLDDGVLVDCYVLLSDVQRGSDEVRTSVGDVLLDRIGPDARAHGRFGTVRRTQRERRRLEDEETVFAALDEAGVPREWVTGIDREKLDVVLSVTDLEEGNVYETERQVYVQKVGVDEGEKRERLAGLAERVSDLESEEADAIREEIADLEERIAGLIGD